MTCSENVVFLKHEIDAPIKTNNLMCIRQTTSIKSTYRSRIKGRLGCMAKSQVAKGQPIEQGILN